MAYDMKWVKGPALSNERGLGLSNEVVPKEGENDQLALGSKLGNWEVRNR